MREMIASHLACKRRLCSSRTVLAEYNRQSTKLIPFHSPQHTLEGKGEDIADRLGTQVHMSPSGQLQVDVSADTHTPRKRVGLHV